MRRADLNLLIALDVLLAEGNVARAARRLHLSASAMSRTLARLRESTGDPLLVRAGRAMVPTPRALELRELAGPLVEQAEALLKPVAPIDLGTLERTFTVRAGDGFVDNFGAALVARVRGAAPGVMLCFLPKADQDRDALREGRIDLETGIVTASAAPELRVQALFRDRFIGVMRAGHPMAATRMTVRRYARMDHIALARRGSSFGPVDEALQAQGLRRNVAATVGGFSAALALARGSDMIATVPERHTGNLRGEMASFTLPLDVPGMTVSMMWHPRQQADQGHRWLRDCVREVCGAS
ncbi:LysR family transcriptional regulator [Massilia sp. PAMC28688]|uniref:LysR family transcriptional regulator n=1 Tax=Massilia sp. PAMC28688 TaxID=2861283 RepID=UPI001C638344|nr:LysR family transcriptional regulator [Massilia sp. PAMC28688]QYF95846.1 LysR family transcriptional regulator [Massilia sp. PAMC28688]